MANRYSGAEPSKSDPKVWVPRPTPKLKKVAGQKKALTTAFKRTGPNKRKNVE